MASACMIGAWTASEGNFWTSSPFYSAATSQSTDDFGVVEQVQRIRLRSQEIDPGAIAATRGEAIVMFLLTLGDQSHPSPDLPVYEVKIRMDDGSILATRQSGTPLWRVGDRVKLVGNRIVALT